MIHKLTLLTYLITFLSKKLSATATKNDQKLSQEKVVSLSVSLFFNNILYLYSQIIGYLKLAVQCSLHNRSDFIPNYIQESLGKKMHKINILVIYQQGRNRKKFLTECKKRILWLIHRFLFFQKALLIGGE